MAKKCLPEGSEVWNTMVCSLSRSWIMHVNIYVYRCQNNFIDAWNGQKIVFSTFSNKRFLRSKKTTQMLSDVTHCRLTGSLNKVVTQLRTFLQKWETWLTAPFALITLIRKRNDTCGKWCRPETVYMWLGGLASWGKSIKTNFFVPDLLLAPPSPTARPHPSLSSTRHTRPQTFDPPGSTRPYVSKCGRLAIWVFVCHHKHTHTHTAVSKDGVLWVSCQMLPSA